MNYPPTELDTQAAADYLFYAAHTLETWRSEGSGPIYHKRGPKYVYYLQSELDDWRRQRETVIKPRKVI